MRKLAFYLIFPFALLLTACGGGGGDSADNPTVGNPGTPTVAITADEAQRFLTKATFGATPSEIDRVIRLGYEGWIDDQLGKRQTLLLPLTDEYISDRTASRRVKLIAEGVTNPEELDRGIGNTQERVSRMDAWWHGAIRADDQLRQRMIFALSQIFVVSDLSGGVDARGYSGYHDVLGKDAFGNYRDLVESVTLNPVMGTFLSLRGSSRAGRNGGTGQPDENYAREVLQLFSIGLVELNIDGTPKLVNGEEVETYTQEDISNFARIYTGWDREGRSSFEGWETVELVPINGDPNDWHDYESKILFDGEVVQANLNMYDDLDEAMDSIFNHPNVGPFISKQLIQRFVTSNPSPAYVERVANVFNNNGSGVRGDLGAVIKAILLDNDSINSHTNMQGGKMKEPLLRISQVWRAFEAQSPVQYIRFAEPESFTGQRPLGAPSVFNFYQPNYAPSGAIGDANLVAPEFNILSDSTVLTAFDKFAEIADSSEVGRVDPFYTTSRNLPMVLELRDAKAIADDTTALLDFMNTRLFGGLMSSGLRTIVATHLDNLPDETDIDQRRETRVEEALILLTVSPEFSVQR